MSHSPRPSSVREIASCRGERNRVPTRLDAMRHDDVCVDTAKVDKKFYEAGKSTVRDLREVLENSFGGLRGSRRVDNTFRP